MKQVLFILFLSFVSIPLKSQYLRINFEHLSVTEGLSQSSVLSITEDKNGFMWFATLDGLNKFNGYEVITYYSGNEKSQLPDNVITALHSTPDTKKQLWIGTADNGISLYNYKKDSFLNYSKKRNDTTLINDHITCIKGNSKILWIGTENGLSKFDQKNDKWTNFIIHKTNQKANYINCFLQTKVGLWIGTKNGLYFLDTLNNQIVRLGENELKNQNVLSLTSDRSGNIWVGTNKGIVIYDKIRRNFVDKKVLSIVSDFKINSLNFDFENILWIGTEKHGLGRFDPVTDDFNFFTNSPTNPNSLSVNTIFDIYEDSNNLLWIGTSLGGVDKWNRVAQDLLVFRHNPYNEHSLSSSKVRSIFEDNNGVIWIGTVDGGLNKWEKELQRFVHIKHNPDMPNSLPENHIRAIYQDSKDRFWIGTANSGLCILNKNTKKIEKIFTHISDDPNSIAGNNIWRITEDNNHNLWIATYGGGLSLLKNNEDNFDFINYYHKKNNPKSLSNNFCTTVYCDSKNRVWIGTNEGLNLFNPQKQNFTVFKYNIQDTTSISNNRIYSILEASDGNIWIGTKGGLNKYNDDGTFKRFTTKSHDLANNIIMGILEDTQKNLWFTTNKGLCKFNMQNYNNRTYNVKDGLQSNEFLVGAYYVTDDNMFIVGGINGFNAFYPEKIKDNPNVPSVVITDLMISNISVNLDTVICEKKYLELPHNKNDLTFKFVAIDYILPEKNQYAYMLEGYDENWIYCKYQRTAKYTNLPPGHYTFKVKGSNNDLLWNEQGAKIHIYIKPAFWQTWAFKIGIVFFILFLIAFFVWLRLRILKRQKKVLKQEVDRQTREIKNKNNALEKQKDEILEQNELLEQQKDEIISQRDEIEQQREMAVKQRDVIALHKKEIEDSIIYAKRIQSATLPENKLLQLLFDQYFIFFKPRDIVSGDFYWASQKNGKIIAIAADCTGHGVPGAFMSMLGISFLNKIVNEKAITEADKILEILRNNVIKSLKQTVEGDTKDGMDIAMCVIDYKTQKIQFSGANNPLYLIRDDRLFEYKSQKMPVAIFDHMQSFQNQIIDFEKGDLIYLFSDGYADQFGGKKGKKFRYKKLKKLLLKNSKYPLSYQKQILELTLKRWMNYPDPYTNEKQFQIDDIIIFGIKL